MQAETIAAVMSATVTEGHMCPVVLPAAAECAAGIDRPFLPAVLLRTAAAKSMPTRHKHVTDLHPALQMIQVAALTSALLCTLWNTTSAGNSSALAVPAIDVSADAEADPQNMWISAAVASLIRFAPAKKL